MNELTTKKIYQGRVIEIKKHKLVVDAGLKTLYNVNIAEFTEDELVDILGKTIHVHIRHMDPLINKTKIASYKRAMHEILWHTILGYKRQNKKVLGRVLNSTKGGYSVHLEIGINAFLPTSHINETSEDIINKEFEFKIIGTNKIHRNVVISKKEIEIDTLEESNKEKFEMLSIGVKINGIVKGINNSGIFINLGHGYHGFVPNNEASYKYEANLSGLFSINQKIECIVLEIDEKNKKLTLSINKITDNPFRKIQQGSNIEIIPLKILQESSMESESAESAKYTLIAKTKESELLCKINPEDNRYSINQMIEIIESKKTMFAKVKYVDITHKVILAITKRSKIEAWRTFYEQYNKSSDKIFNFAIKGKSRFMLFIAHGDFETVMPINSICHNDTQNVFTKYQIGSTISAKVVYINADKQEIICSCRTMDESAMPMFESLIRQRHVKCKIAYRFSPQRLVLSVESKLEISISTHKLAPSVNTALKSDENHEFKMTIVSFNKNTLHLELIPYKAQENNNRGSIQNVSISDILADEFDSILNAEKSST